MYPPDWLNHCHERADSMSGRKRVAEAVGVDPAEGQDSTAMCAVDKHGILELISQKTPDTAAITGQVIAFARKHGLIDSPNKWIFDRGGGGTQHADRLREQGYKGVRTVAFGETLTLDPKRGLRMIEEKMDNKEDKYVFRNRRAQMYMELRFLMDPSLPTQLAGGHGFGIPRQYTELRRQMAPIPITTDGEGRYYLIPKSKKSATDEGPTLTDLLGCSPDELDSLALAVFGMLHVKKQVYAGALG